LATFLISLMSFFSWFCRLCLSLSISLMDFSSIRLFSRSSSAGVFFLPKMKLMVTGGRGGRGRRRVVGVLRLRSGGDCRCAWDWEVLSARGWGFDSWRRKEEALKLLLVATTERGFFPQPPGDALLRIRGWRPDGWMDMRNSYSTLVRR